jgi:hypothetical protein
MIRHSTTFIFLSALMALPLVQSHASSIGGSDLFPDELQSAIRQAALAHGIDADMDFAGSLIGWQKLTAGQLDCAIVAYNETLPTDNAIEHFAVAFQVAKLAVHTSNPTESISYANLISAFAADGIVDSWRSLTDDAAWQNRQISLAAVRGGNAMALEIFNAEVVGDDNLKREIVFSTDTTAITNLFVQNQAVLAIVPAVAEGSNFRFLAVQQDASAPAYSPGADNVLFGDYGLRLPFHVAFREGIDPELRSSWMRALLSDEVTAALEAARFMPIPPTERNALLGTLD